MDWDLFEQEMREAGAFNPQEVPTADELWAQILADLEGDQAIATEVPSGDPAGPIEGLAEPLPRKRPMAGKMDYNKLVCMKSFK